MTPLDWVKQVKENRCIRWSRRRRDSLDDYVDVQTMDSNALPTWEKCNNCFRDSTVNRHKCPHCGKPFAEVKVRV